MKMKISITLRAVNVTDTHGEIIPDEHEYLIEEIKGAVMVFDQKNEPHRAGERITEQAASDLSKGCNVRVLARK